MTTWAQRVGGQALNVIVGDVLIDELKRRFVEGYDGGHPGIAWTSVPDGTLSGAIDNGNGTFTAPIVAVSPRVLDWAGFNAYLVGLLGGGDTGAAALQTILETAQARVGTTTNDKLTRYFYTWFTGSTSFAKADVSARLIALVATAVVTQTQANAVANNWPAP